MQKWRQIVAPVQCDISELSRDKAWHRCVTLYQHVYHASLHYRCVTLHCITRLSHLSRCSAVHCCTFVVRLHYTTSVAVNCATHAIHVSQGGFSQNFQFEIPETFRVKWEGLFHAGEEPRFRSELAMPLVNQKHWWRKKPAKWMLMISGNDLDCFNNSCLLFC